MMHLAGWDDTIVALATPPGVGAIGVIRLSGNSAYDIADKLIPGKKIKEQPSHTIHFGLLKHDGKVLDEVVVSLYKGPHSYTGEDVIEISCHGSPYILQEVMKLCMQFGARQASPGEFTQRAFLNGKMDLAQAEAVADVINAESMAAQQAAMHQLRGGFSGELTDLRDQLIHFAALIELELDFSEEDVEFADRKQLKQLITDIHTRTLALRESFQLGNVVKNGVRVAIVGRPNVGKSTLLNAFINEERAIVSNIPGTTRDSIEEVLNIKGILFRLIDTAGIRSHTVDVIEQMGMDRSRNHAQKADIILFLRDLTANEEPDFEWEKGLAVHWNKDGPFAWLENYAGKVIQVCTKFDQWQAKLDEEGISIIPDFTQNLVSAKTGFGIDALKDAIYEHVLGGKQVVQSNLVTNARHVEALENLQSGLEKVKDGLKQNISGDLLAPEIRSCLYYLGTITGQVEIDRDILGTIFGKFCIGK